MKKILFTLMLLLCATAGWALPDKDEQGYYLVSNLQELKDAVNATKDGNGKSTSKIKLTDDIYLNGMDGTLCTTFAGEMDGSYPNTDEEGRDIIGIRRIFGCGEGDKDKEVKPRDKACSYLFTYMEGAKIKNVGFKAIRIESSDRENMGVIASQAKSTTFEAILVDSCSIWTDKDKAGAVVGLANNCTFKAVVVRQCDVTVDGVKAGGLVGDSEGNKFIGCAVSAGSAVFADGNNGSNHGWSGGLVGYSKNDEFSCCINMALVGADQQHVGGFAGESVGSGFFQCINGGFAANIDEGDFRKVQKEIIDYLKKKNTDLDIAFTTGVLVGGATVAGAVPLYCMIVPAVHYLSIEHGFATWISFFIYEEGSLGSACAPYGWGFSTGGFAAVAAPIIIAAAIIGTAVAIGIYTFLGDDEVGGICGTATGGTFEQCTNSGTLSCKDDYIGGIVGLGKAVTINNCLNMGTLKFDETDTYGSMLGKALADGDKKCKVTNCFSKTPYTLIGSEGISAGVDPASGNNYRWKGSEDTACEWEMVVLDSSISGPSDLKGKQIGYLLNNGFENRRAGIAPWRYEGNLLFASPDLDPSHDEITVESLPHAEISTADELFAFAAAVNGGEQFKVGILMNDIEIPEGKTWTPIGSDEDHSFRGIFDGHGHTISGLEYSTDQENKGAGLFGIVHAGAVIRNVTVKDSNFRNSKEYGAAGIVGRISLSRWGNVVIENCASYADVHGYKHAGGILGRLSAEDAPSNYVFVENCYNGGTITAGYGNSALLCGFVSKFGHISNCWSDGQLRNDARKDIWPYSIDNPKNPKEAECLVGYSSNLDIKNCYIVNPEANVDQYKETKDQYPLQAGVEIVSDEEIATGEFTYMLNGNTNDVTKSLGWQQELGVDDMPKMGNKGVYHTRTISNTIGTVCLPYALKSDDAIRYYTFSESSEANGEIKLNFVYADSLIAGTPAIFVAESTAEPLTFSGAGKGWADSPVAPASAAWDFTGTYVEKTFTGDAAQTIYYVSGGKIKNGKTATIAPYRAYFSGPSIDELTSTGSGARVSIMLDGEEGEISVIELVYENHNDNRSYTLFGTEAGEGYRGIVIRGGKKVMLNR